MEIKTNVIGEKVFSTEEMYWWFFTNVVDVENSVKLIWDSDYPKDLKITFPKFPEPAAKYLEAHKNVRNKYRKHSPSGISIQIGYRAKKKHSNGYSSASGKPFNGMEDNYENYNKLHFPLRTTRGLYYANDCRPSVLDTGGDSYKCIFNSSILHLPSGCARRGEYIIFNFFEKLENINKTEGETGCPLNAYELVKSVNHKQFFIKFMFNCGQILTVSNRLRPETDEDGNVINCYES